MTSPDQGEPNSQSGPSGSPAERLLWNVRLLMVIGVAGSTVMAIANLAMTDAALAQKLTEFRARQYEHAAGMVLA